MKPITHYIDYREYLRDFIEEKREQGVLCSNRWFAMKMQINSSSWLTSVLSGKKGLSRESVIKLSYILKHSMAEARYFETLVAYNQARTLKDRTRFFEELGALQGKKELRKLKVKQYEFYAVWYHTAVWSLVGMKEFRRSDEDIKRLAAMVCPPITVPQAKKSLKLLEDLGFIKENESGIYRHTASALTTGEDIKSLAVNNFQFETMRLAQEALDRFSHEERYIATVTVGVSEKAFQEIRQLLIDTGNRIAEIAGEDVKSDRVFHINMQAFPMSIKK